MVHIVGVVVVYQGKAGSKPPVCPSRKGCVMSSFDTALLPNWARPKATTPEEESDQDEDTYEDDLPDWS